MEAEKNILFFNKKNFFFFKIFLWACVCLIFFGFSILIPVCSYNTIKELIIFSCLIFVVNIHISYLYQIISKKSKFLYFFLLAGSIFICVILEMILYSNCLIDVYSFMDRGKILFFIFVYIAIRDFALFVFFFWVEYFYRLYHLYREKEKFYKEKIALLIEKQEFEKKFSRKRLLPHYFFNVLEHINLESLGSNINNELMNKVKFVLYYFLVDAEKEIIELDKELAFYKYYIELENLRHRKDISINFNVIGQPENFSIIPLLFEPLISNAMKYTKHDGTGWVDILVDAQNFPVLKFHCKNNYLRHLSNITSSENGLKILEQRLELCYKNKHDLIVTQGDDLYEVALAIEIV